MGLQLRILEGDYSVNRLPGAAPIPSWADGEGFVSISRAPYELSIVCLSSRVPDPACQQDENQLEGLDAKRRCPPATTSVPETLDEGCRSEQGWMCLQLVGPFAFTLTGILLAVLEPLAEAKVGIFAVSTFDTDYVMVKTIQRTETLEALSKAGHTIV